MSMGSRNFCDARDAVIRRRWPLDHPASDVHAAVVAIRGPAVTVEQVVNRAKHIGVPRSPGFRVAVLLAAQPAAVETSRAVGRPRECRVWTPARVEAIRAARLGGALLPAVLLVANGPEFSALRPVSEDAVHKTLIARGIRLPADVALAHQRASGAAVGARSRRPPKAAPVAKPRPVPVVASPRPALPAPVAVSPPPPPPAPVLPPAPVEPPPLGTGHVPLTFSECVAWLRSKGVPQDARAGIGFDGSNVGYLNQVRARFRMAPVVVVEQRRVAA